MIESVRRGGRAVAVAAGLALFGLVAGILVVAAGRTALPFGPDDGALWAITEGFLQIGMLAVAAAYLAYRGAPTELVSVRRPTVEDAAWIVAIPLILFGVGQAQHLLADAFAVPGPTGGASHGDSGLVATAASWLVLYLIAAPGEELLYRGVVQGRLRESFGSGAAVVGSALLFTLLHFALGVAGAEATAFGTLLGLTEFAAGGLLWGYAYERTGNLLVPAITHAALWTQPWAAVLAVL